MSDPSSAPLSLTLRPGDAAWPARLADLASEAPAELRVLGRLPELAGAIAIVGTRFADEEAIEFTRTLAAQLAAAGRTVISGGARGIDAAAHLGALDAGGATVAVLASGFDPAYPPEHTELFVAIAGSGALACEHPDGTPPHRGRFLQRNRLIAALASAVVVVQAPLRSGALSTAALGIRLKRPVLTVPYPPWSTRGSGCLGLLRRGAQICTSSRDVLSVPAHRTEPGIAPELLFAEKADDFEDLDQHNRAVLRALSRRPRHPDELASSLRLPILKVQQCLGQLALLGLAGATSDGRYVRQVDPDQR
jgi:DNA processing protein